MWPSLWRSIAMFFVVTLVGEMGSSNRIPLTYGLSDVSQKAASLA